MKNIRIFYLKILIFFGGKISIIHVFEVACFRNGIALSLECMVHFVSTIQMSSHNMFLY